MHSPQVRNTLSKAERISSKADMDRLLFHACHGSVPPLRYGYVLATGAGLNRMMVSVPKRYFKRAVKRNLFKRRIREAYRTQKSLLPAGGGIDMIFIYNTKEVTGFAGIREAMGRILKDISKAAGDEQDR